MICDICCYPPNPTLFDTRKSFKLKLNYHIIIPNVTLEFYILDSDTFYIETDS